MRVVFARRARDGNYLARNCGRGTASASSRASTPEQRSADMNQATEVAELGFASRKHLPFVVGAAADLLLGLDLLLAGELMAEWLVPGAPAVAGIATASIMHAVGALLLAVAVATLAFTWLDASRKTLWSIVLLNEAWIVGSAVLVIFAHDAFSGAGNAIVLGLAAILAGLTYAQFRNLRQAREA
jgi:hypothetical protein